MYHPLIKHVQNKHLRNCPEIRVGYTVKVHQRISEGGKERIQIFEGLVIKVGSGHGTDKTFTVRKIIGGIGVEKTFPFHSATVSKIEVVKKAKIRRAKLYYMRERSGKSARLKEEHVSIVGDMSLVNEEVEMPAEEETAAEAENTELTEETSAPAEEPKVEEAEAKEEPKAEEKPAKEEEA